MLALALLLAAAPAFREGEVVLRDFKFASGQTLPALRLHYRTLGQPRPEAVLVLHGTTGSSAQFTGDQFAGELFGDGQPLDAGKTFIVIPDNLGHGQSSKPSDGLHARFPRYGYADMVEAQRLLLEKLGVTHLKVIIGTSMGCMHAWVWLEKSPDFVEAALPLACLPVQIAGRNRVMRKMVIDAIRTDPAWRGGEYKKPPRRGLRAALDALLVMGSAPLVLQGRAPTRDAADAFYEAWMKKRLTETDANDFVYAFEASSDYDPRPGLEQIKARVIAVNSADDFINPPELGILEREVARVPHGKAVVLPISEATRGHGTHTLPALWKQYLLELLSSPATQ